MKDNEKLEQLKLINYNLEMLNFTLINSITTLLEKLTELNTIDKNIEK